MPLIRATIASSMLQSLWLISEASLPARRRSRLFPQLIRYQRGVAGDVVPGVDVVRIARQDATDFVDDHFQSFALHATEREAFLLLGVSEHGLQRLCISGMVPEIAMLLAALSEDGGEFSHSFSPSG